MHCVNAIRHNSIEKTVAKYRLIDINAYFPLHIFPVAIFSVAQPSVAVTSGH